MTRFFNVLAVTLFLFDHGLSSIRVSLIEGDLVTLHTGVETKHQEDIKWYFGITRIAHIRGDLSKICTDVQCNAGTESFIDRLQLDHQTGSLTIKDTTNTDTGEYKLKIISSSDREKTFSVFVTDVPAAELYEIKEGESVTLEAGVLQHPNYVTTWYFNNTLIVQFTGGKSEICADDQCKERFRDRLKLDQTGSLTITDTRNTDSGEYKLQINIKDSDFSITREKRFSFSVADSDLSSGVVAGLIVAVVVLVAVAVVAAGVFFCHRRSHRAVPQNEDDEGNSPPGPNNIPLK